MHQQIVRKIANKSAKAGDSVRQNMNHIVEPSLLPHPKALLPSFADIGWSNTFTQYLVKRVRRNPRDLRAHVQRTLLYLSKRDSEAVYAALIDLFLILGNRGTDIRKNLLNQAEPLLKKEQYQFLVDRMKSGLDSNEPLPSNTLSSLSRGHSGTTRIVSRKISDPNHSAPLEQAMECFHQNDWLTAMIILEDALHHDPGDAAVCRELLSLYKKQQAREAFHRTYTSLFGRCLALPELWRDTEKFFS